MNKALSGGDQLSADIVVIGSGPGGAITATLFAEAGKSVLLLEEGPDLPLESAPAFSSEEIMQKYRNSGINLALGRAMIAYVEGRCVGGGSEINRGLYHRTPAYVLEKWRSEFGVHDLSSESLEPHFAECEKTARVERLPGKAPVMSTLLHEGAVSLGWRSKEAPRLYHYDDSGGRKQSMSETFVRRFLGAGGRLLADTRVHRISRTAGKWTARARHAPGLAAPREIEITAEFVVAACGAVHTPALLRRSGITRNIGNSLRFHPMVKAVAVFDHEVNQPDDMDAVHQIREFEPKIGIGCSKSTPATLALALANQPEWLREVDENWRRMAIYYAQCPSGPAKVRNMPFFRDPVVTVNQSESNLRDLAEGLRLLSEALFAAGAVAVHPCVPGYPTLRSPRDAARLPELIAARGGALTSVHVFSSCPMGEDPSRCAADSYGRVNGVDGLYIADASLLCGPTTVNPQGTVMAIVHRNARMAIESRLG